MLNYDQVSDKIVKHRFFEFSIYLDSKDLQLNGYVMLQQVTPQAMHNLMTEDQW